MSWARRRTRAALRVPLAALLALVLGTLVTLPLATPRAGAAEPDQPVSITIASLTPSVITDRDPDTPITITGTFRNTGTEPITRPQAFLWRSTERIGDAEGLAHTQASAATEPFGERVTDVESAVDDLYTDAKPSLAPGARVSFEVSATLADLTLPDADGVYLVGVQAREDFGTTVGRARLFLPVVTDTPKTLVQMASLVLLSSRPSLLSLARAATDESPAAAAVLTDDHLAAEVADGGRLDQLLDTADTDATSFAVDPDLVATLTQMRDGYTVQSTDGTTRAGTGAAAAGRWLQRFGQVTDRRDGYRLPYAATDLAALAHADQTDVITDGERASAQVDAVADLPLLAMPTDGLADAATLAAAEDLDPKAYLLSDAVTGGAGPLLKGPGGHPIVAFSASSSVGGPGPSPSTTPTHQRQAFLATSWIRAEGVDDGTSVGSVRVIDGVDDADGAPIADAPWLRRSSLADLLSGTPSAAPDSLSYPGSARQAELDGTQLRAAADLERYGSRYADLVTTAGADVRAAAVTARAASGAWRGQPERSAALTDRQVAGLRSDLDTKLVISGGSRATLTSRGDQEFPLTVTNKMSEPVRVRLVFDSPFPQRLSVKSTELTPPLQPGESRQVRNEAVARTNGTFPVTARLQTDNGRPVGNRWTVQVTAADVSGVGWLIVIGSGATLVGATAFRIRQVRRERKQDTGSQPPVGTAAGGHR